MDESIAVPFGPQSGRPAGVSALQRRREGQSRGHNHQAGQRVGPHLLHHPPSVCLHRDLGNAEFATDLLVQAAGDDQPHDFPFATAERGLALPQRPYLRLMTMAAFDGVPDCTQQHLIVDRFVKRATAPAF